MTQIININIKKTGKNCSHDSKKHINKKRTNQNKPEQLVQKEGESIGWSLFKYAALTAGTALVSAVVPAVMPIVADAVASIVSSSLAPYIAIGAAAATSAATTSDDTSSSGMPTYPHKKENNELKNVLRS